MTRQIANMFMGECLCFIASLIVNLVKYLRRGRGNAQVEYENISDDFKEEHDNELEADELAAILEKDPQKIPFTWKKCYLFFLPAFCDFTATTLMNVGLTLIYASVYQMLRSTLIIFVAIFSVIFLHRHLFWFHWLGVGLIAGGTLAVALVTLYVVGMDETSARNPAVGTLFIVAAQLIVAIQFTVEEKFLSRYETPVLTAVGIEGLFGLFVTVAVAIPIADKVEFDDFSAAIYQFTHNSQIMIGVIGSICSIAFYNFMGVSVTKRISAGGRAAVNSLRTFTIWIACIFLDWEEYNTWVLLSYLVVTAGSLFYNEVFARARPELPRNELGIEDAEM
eukprot:gnl/Chilomastix_cuspidata/520.p1 GENE.gnl/Chilomastix_cuspidata/520~~gnl/Chilomastix_cuspidata/520.p1  ORF type:complete len:336 (+),score=127.47 gnl/Chilomastix_cuspidata/520:172-1179(+)